MLAFLLANAAQVSPEPTPTPAPTHQAKVGDFMLLQLWTDKPDEFVRKWNQPTPPTLEITAKIERNKTIAGFVIFAGCKADAAGNCDLQGSIEFRDPDGQIYAEHKNVNFFNGPAIQGYDLRLSPSGPALVIEDGEKLGTYTARITVTDRNANVTAITEQKLTVVEAPVK